jgi:hypothetical protein
MAGAGTQAAARGGPLSASGPYGPLPLGNAHRSASCASRSQWAANCSQVFLCSWWVVAWANSRHVSAFLRNSLARLIGDLRRSVAGEARLRALIFRAGSPAPLGVHPLSHLHPELRNFEKVLANFVGWRGAGAFNTFFDELAILGSCSHDISLQLQAGALPAVSQPPPPEARAAAGDVNTRVTRIGRPVCSKLYSLSPGTEDFQVSFTEHKSTDIRLYFDSLERLEFGYGGQGSRPRLC